MTDDKPQPSAQELDVPGLLRSSIPSDARRKLPIIILVSFGSLALIGIAFGEKSQGLSFLTSGLILLMVMALMVFGFFITRRSRREAMALESIGELIQLRQWPKASGMLEGLLSSPMKSPQARLQALAFLIHVLNRFHRYSDMVDVYDHLLDQQLVDDSSVYNLRAGRAMAMLRDERLYDADKAIGQLRQTGPEDSPPLVVLELYHALKTGRSQDLLEEYVKRRDHLKAELGPKTADAHAFAAAAYFQMGDAEQAGKCWMLATVLTPPLELLRRFPELKTVSGACAAAEMPQEGAA